MRPQLTSGAHPSLTSRFAARDKSPKRIFFLHSSNRFSDGFFSDEGPEARRNRGVRSRKIIHVGIKTLQRDIDAKKSDGDDGGARGDDEVDGGGDDGGSINNGNGVDEAVDGGGDDNNNKEVGG
eukprot:m.130589 g.130589  ORF g.130589 m.130589 type:complete len:124 (+) comp38034_c2_seq2:164-535(+)